MVSNKTIQLKTQLQDTSPNPSISGTNSYKLTTRNRKYCAYIVQGYNSVDAYLLSGYTAKNHQTALSSSSKLFRNPRIQAEINRLKSLGNQDDITPENVLKGIASIAFSATAKDTDRLVALDKLARHLRIFTDESKGNNINIMNVIPSAEDRASLYQKLDELERKEARLTARSGLIAAPGDTYIGPDNEPDLEHVNANDCND